MYAVYLFIQLLILVVFYVLLHVFEAIRWAKVQVRVRSKSMDNYHNEQKNNRR